ncbi:predicted protein [Chaetoceros tenuissimus]|uniref:Uncharacterized protein n=1 Tax=Chaetoceros tenuissimus TaxID=426638 RepID=A0AAD3D016_9STRA|nr:predicted protein [Chaetoceros tenuissimus]
MNVVQNGERVQPTGQIMHPILYVEDRVRAEARAKVLGGKSAVGSVLRFSENSCSGSESCLGVGRSSKAVLELSYIGQNSCTSEESCF